MRAPLRVRSCKVSLKGSFEGSFKGSFVPFWFPLRARSCKVSLKGPFEGSFKGSLLFWFPLGACSFMSQGLSLLGFGHAGFGIGPAEVGTYN